MSRRVLWFVNVDLTDFQRAPGYNGGGWMTALLEHMQVEPDIELGVAFLSADKGLDKSFERNGVRFFPMRFQGTGFVRIVRWLSYEAQIVAHIKKYTEVVDLFRPDLIHVFGSERPYGLVAESTDIPVALHVQGTLSAYQHAFLPPGLSLLSWLVSALPNFSLAVRRAREYRNFLRAAELELRIYKSVDFVLGRTEWDRRIACLFSGARYMYCDEMLRKEFYHSEPVDLGYDPEEINIVSTISSPTYKGLDQVLKIARELKNWSGLRVNWRVFGVTESHVAQMITGANPADIGVHIGGILSAAELIRELKHSDIYFHPSYIENGCISVSEARILGVPAIAFYAGGMISTIDHMKTGILCPLNEPHIAASYILELHSNHNLASDIGANGRKHAKSRHNVATILSQIKAIYHAMSAENSRD